MKLSIIIALYNTEKYIEKCIRSIYTKSQIHYKEFEVLVINDGSTDDSPIIVERLQKEFRNLILINKQNGGQSTARNMGFNKARGEYLFCLDSDDYVNAKQLFNALDYCIKQQLDCLPIKFNLLDKTYQSRTPEKENYPMLITPVSGGEFLCNYTISGSMCRYFYKRDVLKKNKLKLIEGIYHEDEDFVVRYLSYCERIAYQGHLVYNYVVRENSTVNNRDKKHRVKLLHDLLIVIENLQQHKKNFVNTSKEYIGISKKIEQLSVSLFLRMKADSLSFDEAMMFVNKLKAIYLYPIKIKKQSLKFKLASMLFNNKLILKIIYR